jgi:hypothetical protein
MAHRTRNGFCTRVVASRRQLAKNTRLVRTSFAQFSSRANEYRESISVRVSELLAACAAAAAPRFCMSSTMEKLENRQLLSSVSLTGGTLTLTGNSSGNNALIVDVGSSGSIAANANGQMFNATTASVKNISITGGSGNDWVYINPSLGLPATISTFAGNDTIKGGSGIDVIDGGEGDNLIYGSGTITLGSGKNTVFPGSPSTRIISGGSAAGAAPSVTTTPSTSPAPVVQVAATTGPTPFLGHSFNINTDVIQAENFDNGGEGVAYHNTSAPNLGSSQYRNTAVDLVVSSTSQVSVGYNSPGEWLKYTINAPAAGRYVLQANVANPFPGGSFHAEVDGVNVTGTVNMPTTSGWFSDQIVQSSAFNVSAGTHVLRIVMDSNDSMGAVGNFDYFKFAATPISNPSPPPPPVSTPTPVPIPPPVSTPVPLPQGAEDASVVGSNHGDWQAPIPVMNLKGISGQAHHSVFVDALSSTLGDGQAITTHYQWNFGDPGSRFNVLPGFNAGHIYDNPGTYTISLTVTNDLGKSSTLSTRVTVAPDTRRTIYVDSWYGSDNNSGASANQAVRSWQKAQSLFGDNVTVLFRRGETFDFGDTLLIGNRNMIFGAYGSGAAPVMRKVDGPGHGIFGFNDTADQIVVENLTFDSIYVAQNGIAPHITAVAIYPAGRNITIRNNTFLNVDDAVNAYRSPTGVLVQDNLAPLKTGIRGYFAYLDGTDWTIVGNTVVNSTREHDIRSTDDPTARVLIADNNLDNPVLSTDPGESYKTVINIRSGHYFYVTGNTISDNMIGVGPGPWTPDYWAAENIVIDGNVMHNAQIYMAGNVHHAMISNNVLDIENTQQIELRPLDPDYADRAMSDVYVENNTGITTSHVGEMIMLDGPSRGPVITVKDNLFAAPNFQAGSNFASSVVVHDVNASAFKLFSHNVWSASTNTNVGKAGGLIFVNPGYNWQAYLTATEWNNQANVKDDQFRLTAMQPGHYFQVPIDGEMAGAVLPAPLG